MYKTKIYIFIYGVWDDKIGEKMTTERERS